MQFFSGWLHKPNWKVDFIFVRKGFYVLNVGKQCWISIHLTVQYWTHGVPTLRYEFLIAQVKFIGCGLIIEVSEVLKQTLLRFTSCKCTVQTNFVNASANYVRARGNFCSFRLYVRG